MAAASGSAATTNDVEAQLVRVVDELEAARRRLVTIADDPHERNTLEEQILRLEDDLVALEHKRAHGSGGTPTQNSTLGALEGSDLSAFLQAQPVEMFSRLFTDTTSCLALFTILPVLAKHFVMRFVFVSGTIGDDIVRQWSLPEAFRGVGLHQEAERVLSSLHIWSHDDALCGYALDKTFRKSMRTALAGGGRPWCDRTSLKGRKRRVAVDLDSYGKKKWESVLSAMVDQDNSAQNIGALDSGVMDVLFRGDLLSGVPGLHTVTKRGFQFLLQSQRAQVWFYVFQLCTSLSPESVADVLALVFRLSFSTPGDDYPVDGFSAFQQTLLAHFGSVGLLYRKPESKRYYTTSVSTHLMTTQKSTDVSEDATKPRGYIIVETNFKVFAYDPSDLQLALLKLFMDIECLLPNMAIGVLSRRSIRTALLNGISAEQITCYLQMHAHERMAPLKEASPWSPIPSNITDQLFLWQWETQRAKAVPGCLYSEFDDDDDFVATLRFAEEVDAVLWCDKAKQKMVVTPVGHRQVKQWRKAEREGFL